MAVINRKLQFQVLLLRGTFSAVYNAAYHADCGAVYNAAHLAAYDDASHATYRTAYYAVSDATLNATFNAAFNAAFNVAYNAAYNVAYDAAKNSPEKGIDAKMLASFMVVFKADSKIQEMIKAKAMVEIPIDFKLLQSELELVKSLLEVDISRMIAVVQTYWMYSISCCLQSIIVMDGSDVIKIFGEKRRKLNVSEKYLNLLNVPKLEILGDLLLRPLRLIVESYYGLMERELFICELLKMCEIL